MKLTLHELSIGHSLQRAISPQDLQRQYTWMQWHLEELFALAKKALEAEAKPCWSALNAGPRGSTIPASAHSQPNTFRSLLNFLKQTHTMNTELRELISTLHRIEAGEPWQYCHYSIDETWHDGGKMTNPLTCIGVNFKIRLTPKPACVMPPPPDGCEYHNPENVPLSKVPEGWRFTLLEENDGRYRDGEAQFWNKSLERFQSSGDQASKWVTYIVPADTLFPERKPEPVWLDLGPDDVPPFSVIRRKDEEQNWHWRVVTFVHGQNARCADRGYPWAELARDYEINRSLPLTGKWDANAWEACRKEAV